MKRLLLHTTAPTAKAWPLVLPLLLVLSGCYKDDLEPSTWTNNPFDPGYTGPAVFSVDTTYLDLVGSPPTVVTSMHAACYTHATRTQ